ncbi:MAG TPA: PhzF family phenazine biosynthesis protein [Vicinamibacteria bacterium]|nr:PhzF family phenazine biosynthesis protein [Vicinamibacteria bacterium]
MKIPLFQIDAFTDKVFRGNPACVCPVERWPRDVLMQSIAAENNVPETAFFQGGNGKYKLRWFTPVREVDLCGHATLAAAWVVFNMMEKKREHVTFNTLSGPLYVSRAQKDLFALDFPSRPPEPCDPPAGLVEGLGLAPKEIWASRDYMAVYESEEQVRSLRPDMGLLRALPGDKLGVIATARGDKADFVSRFFAPKAGIPEDPVTGSSHCTLIPYWAERLGKDRLQALQVSRRGGELFCMPRGERVAIAGRAVLYLKGAVDVPSASGVKPA